LVSILRESVAILLFTMRPYPNPPQKMALSKPENAGYHNNSMSEMPPVRLLWCVYIQKKRIRKIKGPA
jgi:hypothetical protein